MGWYHPSFESGANRDSNSQNDRWRLNLRFQYLEALLDSSLVVAVDQRQSMVRTWFHDWKRVLDWLPFVLVSRVGTFSWHECGSMCHRRRYLSNKLENNYMMYEWIYEYTSSDSNVINQKGSDWRTWWHLRPHHFRSIFLGRTHTLRHVSVDFRAVVLMRNVHCCSKMVCRRSYSRVVILLATIDMMVRKILMPLWKKTQLVGTRTTWYHLYPAPPRHNT